VNQASNLEYNIAFLSLLLSTLMSEVGTFGALGFAHFETFFGPLLKGKADISDTKPPA